MREHRRGVLWCTRGFTTMSLRYPPLAHLILVPTHCRMETQRSLRPWIRLFCKRPKNCAGYCKASTTTRTLLGLLFAVTSAEAHSLERGVLRSMLRRPGITISERRASITYTIDKHTAGLFEVTRRLLHCHE